MRIGKNTGCWHLEYISRLDDLHEILGGIYENLARRVFVLAIMTAGHCASRCDGYYAMKEVV